MSRLYGYFRLVHPFPSLLVTAVTVALLPLADRDARFALYVELGLGMLCFQFAIGAANDAADAALDAATPHVTARIDCGAPIDLAPAGGWSYGAAIPALPAGTHSLELHASSPAGRELTASTSFYVCAPAQAPARGDWPQVGGGAEHPGAVATPVTPPLQVAWSTSVGGTLALGTPVAAGDTVIVASTDRSAGDAGGPAARPAAGRCGG